MSESLNPYQPPDQGFAAPPPKPGQGPIVLRGPYASEELDYESPEVENTAISSMAAVVTLLLCLTAPFNPPWLYLAPAFAVLWVVALWIERRGQRAAEARFRQQRLERMEQITLDETGVSVTIDRQTSWTAWGLFGAGVEEPARFVLSGEAWFWLPLPRRLLVNEGDWERLGALIRQHTPAEGSGGEASGEARHRGPRSAFENLPEEPAAVQAEIDETQQALAALPAKGRGRLTLQRRLAQLYLLQHAYERMDEQYTAIQGWSRTADDFFWRGVARQRLGRLPAAAADFSAAVELAPQYALAWSERARIEQDLADPVAAERDYARALEVEPRLAETYLEHAEAHLERGEARLARRDYEQAVRLDPDNWQASHDLAWLLATHAAADARDGAAAILHAQRACELAPEDPLSKMTLAAAQAEAGEFATAIQGLERLLQDRNLPYELREDAERRLTSYREGKPVYETP